MQIEKRKKFTRGYSVFGVNQITCIPVSLIRTLKKKKYFACTKKSYWTFR